MSRLYAIGDIHGHQRELLDLITQLINDGMDPARDTVVFLGDYVDGGPDTRQVLDTLIEWGKAYPHWVFVRGNHDQMMLDAMDHPDDWGTFIHWFHQGGQETFASYLPSGFRDKAFGLQWVGDRGQELRTYVSPEHITWLRSLPLYHETDRYIFVHAGLRPPLPPQACSAEDLLWIRDDFINSRHDWGKVVVYGHTPVREPLVMFNKIGIDTLPRNVGKLCAVELELAEPRFTFEDAA